MRTRLFLYVIPPMLALAACLPAIAPRTQGSDAILPSAQGTASCQVTRVIDGDTVDLRCAGSSTALRARLMGFDTPETYEPRCAAEANLGQRATRRLRNLVRQSVRTDVQFDGIDRYDRRLVRLRLDGRDVGDILIAEGVALPYGGGRRPDWCARLG